MSSNDGNTPRNRGRHGDDDYRTFPRGSSEVPRTFPTDANGNPSSPRRDSSQAGQGTGQSGQGSEQPTRSYPATTGFGASSGDEQTRIQPTHAQTPVDSARPGAGSSASGQNSSGVNSSSTGTSNTSSASTGLSGQSTSGGQGSGYGQTSQYGQASASGQPNPYSQSGSHSQSGASGTGQSSTHSQPGSSGFGQSSSSGGYGQSSAYGQGAKGSASGGQYSSPGQSSGAPGGAAAAGFGAAAGYGAGQQTAGQSGAGQYGSGQPGTGQQSSVQSGAGTYGSGQSATGQSGAAQYGSGQSASGQYGAGQYGSGQSGSGQYGASGQGQYAAAGANPYGIDPNGAGAGSGQPPRRTKRGPGWGATIAIALIAALIGGGAAFGGSYAVTAMQDDTESRKVADQTIETPDWTEVAKTASEGVVSIQAAAGGRVVALGSGSLYDDQGRVITNNHVVAPSDTPGGELTVTMKNGSTMRAEIVGRDPSTDIAIIKLDQVPQGVKPLPVGDSKALSVGDPVMALGNPLGLADSVTTGIVSALDRPVTTENIGENATAQQKELTITNAIQTDAAINPGNSGGPLVDGNGNFIGVNSAAASLGQGEEGQQSGSIGIGFAIPASQAVMIADQLIATGKAKHPFLGVRLTDGQINAGGITRASAKIQSVEAGSPAAAAGMKDGDDVIAVGSTKVTSAISLQALVRAQPVNTPVEFTIVRGGQEQKLSVTLVLR
ncbi:hypothetical protein KACC15558_07150 [Brevibacterium ammoniilyticum]|uniref:PDZ domain-containing protein n=1 Tax=Brevibacterium ammoniilyticum TaxID=1046555 RepID=A0ABP9TWQ8_9MICO